MSKRTDSGSNRRFALQVSAVVGLFALLVTTGVASARNGDLDPTPDDRTGNSIVPVSVEDDSSTTSFEGDTTTPSSGSTADSTPTSTEDSTPSSGSRPGSTPTSTDDSTPSSGSTPDTIDDHGGERDDDNSGPGRGDDDDDDDDHRGRGRGGDDDDRDDDHSGHGRDGDGGEDD